MTQKIAQIHRFGDCVAMYLSNGETVYMTPRDAKLIAKELNACAKDVKEHTYLQSEFRAAVILLEDTGYNGCGFEFTRRAKNEISN